MGDDTLLNMSCILSRGCINVKEITISEGGEKG